VGGARAQRSYTLLVVTGPGAAADLTAAALLDDVRAIAS
jgi:homoserine dehydrogenase